MSELFQATTASDGFFLNLSSLFLKLSKPFLDPKSPNLLKIDPTYCVVSRTAAQVADISTPVHMVGLLEEDKIYSEEGTGRCDPKP